MSGTLSKAFPSVSFSNLGTKAKSQRAKSGNDNHVDFGHKLRSSVNIQGINFAALRGMLNVFVKIP
jgi:hypothetical protein